jgi:hypothetical protein
LLAGMLTGLYAASLARRADGILKNKSNKTLFDANSFIEVENNKTKKSKHRRWWFKPSGIIFFILTVSLFAYSYFYPDYPYIKKDSLIVMLFRGVLLMFIWYKFLSPLLMNGFKKVMNKKRNKYTKEIENVVNFLPLLKSIISFCWRETSSEKGLKRLHRFFSLSLLNLLTVELIKNE